MNVESIKQNKGVQKIKQTWDENPMMVIGVAAGALMALSKIIDSISGIQSRTPNYIQKRR